MRRREFVGSVPFLATAIAAAPSKVQRWTVVTIGNLSRNRYWGEPDDKPLRDAICTCTLISGEGFELLVDPSLPARADMAKELNRRTGLKPDDVTAVFVTQEHAVPMRDFWRERRSYYNAVDPALGARTMDQLASLASIIVPGHDNYFLVSS
jgi:hypothetical protein